MNEHRRHPADCRRRLPRCVFVAGAVFGFILVGLLVAADPVVRTPLDQQIESLIGLPETTTGPSPKSVEIPREMQQAGDELRSRQTDAALNRQREILTRLDELLASATLQTAQQNSKDPMSSEPAGVSPDAAGENGTESGAPADGPARESSSSAAGTRSAASILEHRRNLATAVWGHLPDREREEMLQSYREEFLPDYADLVERYYESLAAERLKSPSSGSLPRELPAEGPRTETVELP